MKATKKELKCIEISRRLRNKEKSPIFLTPKKYIREFELGLAEDVQLWKKIIFYFIFIIIYSLTAPISFFIALKEMLFDKKNSLSREVSEIKSFLQLWKDKGLGNYEDEYEDEKIECIYEWTKILYGGNNIKLSKTLQEFNDMLAKVELDNFVDNIIERHSDSTRTFYKRDGRIYSHFTGSSRSNLIDICEVISEELVKEIDIHFGHYTP